MPAYHPASTPSRGMGAVPEVLRTWPGARRSDHPHLSFAAVGLHASRITAGHQLADGLGEGAPGPVVRARRPRAPTRGRPRPQHLATPGPVPDRPAGTGASVRAGPRAGSTAVDKLGRHRPRHRRLLRPRFGTRRDQPGMARKGRSSHHPADEPTSRRRPRHRVVHPPAHHLALAALHSRAARRDRKRKAYRTE